MKSFKVDFLATTEKQLMVLKITFLFQEEWSNTLTNKKLKEKKPLLVPEKYGHKQ